MKMTLSRSLLIVLALGVPMTLGGLYALSKANSPKYLVAKNVPPCCCCCDGVSRESLVSAQVKDGASDSPLFGGTPQRNLINLVDKNIPIDFSVEEGKEKGVKWSVDVGTRSYGGPVIAGGRVYMGTNNAKPRDPKIKEAEKAVLMAFDEKSGKFLWQIVHDIPKDPLFKEAENEGLCSTPVVEGDGIFYVTPGCEVVRASTDGKVVWKYDMMKELHVEPFHLSNCSPLIVGDNIMVVTGNGNEGEGVKNPKAPSFIAVNKTTGKLVWQSALPGANIIEGQWSNPTVAEVAGKKQVIFPGGDGVLYSLDPSTGEMIWKFDCHPVRPKGDDKVALTYFIATPVVVGDKAIIGLGVYPEHPSGVKFSHLFCVDITKKGDVSPKSLNVKDAANKDSALVWVYGGPIEPRPKTGRAAVFGSTISTIASLDNLVYAAEMTGFIHCIDAKTGQRVWMQDLQANVWGSPYYVDGKVFVASDDGVVHVYNHGKDAKKIAAIEFLEAIHSTPVVANGTLYIATQQKLFAIGPAAGEKQ